MASASRPHSAAEIIDTSGGQTSPQDQRLRPPYSGGEEGQSSSDAPLRPKRAQVKNACVNCQRACKKCDSGRPCQRCIKYNLVDSCVDSKRKPRKKGIKRGPYKKRKKNNPEDEAALHNQPPETSLGESSIGMPLAGSSGANVTTPQAPAAAVAAAAVSRRSSVRATRTEQKKRQQRRLQQQKGNEERAPKPPVVLGPGAIPILHTDPVHDDEVSDESSSDVPLVIQQRSAAQAMAHGHTQYGMPPETPTSGLTMAFRSLDTGHRVSEPLSQHHGAISPPAARLSHPHHQPAAPYPQSTIGSIRLPPIESFDHAQALGSPPSTSSLAILTDVALGHTSSSLPPPLSVPAVRTHPAPQVMHPPLPQPPAQYPQHPHVSAEDTNQQSQLYPPSDDHHSRHTTSTAESDVSTNYASSFDSRQSPDINSRAYIRRLSHRLHHTHIEQESADS
ncbi:hypothetical protein IWW36_001823 [Coemansia brasiliensis]|uniref:Zn(2)-C6 fungal-type domain-containing protein n=1 Tax=Coemansia brasiliensis TaxID=2650707 RepID=A0A9W8IAW2_9FUNG|nr:hypothetical protein IWW36_001823 [Coemansia brasiliensis]